MPWAVPTAPLGPQDPRGDMQGPHPNHAAVQTLAPDSIQRRAGPFAAYGAQGSSVSSDLADNWLLAMTQKHNANDASRERRPRSGSGSGHGSQAHSTNGVSRGGPPSHAQFAAPIYGRSAGKAALGASKPMTLTEHWELYLRHKATGIADVADSVETTTPRDTLPCETVIVESEQPVPRGRTAVPVSSDDLVADTLAHLKWLTEALVASAVRRELIHGPITDDPTTPAGFVAALARVYTPEPPSGSPFTEHHPHASTDAGASQQLTPEQREVMRSMRAATLAKRAAPTTSELNKMMRTARAEHAISDISSSVISRELPPHDADLVAHDARLVAASVLPRMPSSGPQRYVSAGGSSVVSSVVSIEPSVFAEASNIARAYGGGERSSSLAHADRASRSRSLGKLDNSMLLKTLTPGEGLTATLGSASAFLGSQYESGASFMSDASNGSLTGTGLPSMDSARLRSPRPRASLTSAGSGAWRSSGHARVSPRPGAPGSGRPSHSAVPPLPLPPSRQARSVVHSPRGSPAPQRLASASARSPPAPEPTASMASATASHMSSPAPASVMLPTAPQPAIVNFAQAQQQFQHQEEREQLDSEDSAMVDDSVGAPRVAGADDDDDVDATRRGQTPTHLPPSPSSSMPLDEMSLPLRVDPTMNATPPIYTRDRIQGVDSTVADAADDIDSDIRALEAELAAMDSTTQRSRTGSTAGELLASAAVNIAARASAAHQASRKAKPDSPMSLPSASPSAAAVLAEGDEAAADTAWVSRHSEAVSGSSTGTMASVDDGTSNPPDPAHHTQHTPGSPTGLSDLVHHRSNPFGSLPMAAARSVEAFADARSNGGSAHLPVEARPSGSAYETFTTAVLASSSASSTPSGALGPSEGGSTNAAELVTITASIKPRSTSDPGGPSAFVDAVEALGAASSANTSRHPELSMSGLAGPGFDEQLEARLHALESPESVARSAAEEPCRSDASTSPRPPEHGRSEALEQPEAGDLQPVLTAAGELLDDDAPRASAPRVAAAFPSALGSHPVPFDHSSSGFEDTGSLQPASGRCSLPASPDAAAAAAPAAFSRSPDLCRDTTASAVAPDAETVSAAAPAPPRSSSWRVKPATEPPFEGIGGVTSVGTNASFESVVPLPSPIPLERALHYRPNIGPTADAPSGGVYATGPPTELSPPSSPVLTSSPLAATKTNSRFTARSGTGIFSEESRLCEPGWYTEDESIGESADIRASIRELEQQRAAAVADRRSSAAQATEPATPREPEPLAAAESRASQSLSQVSVARASDAPTQTDSWLPPTPDTNAGGPDAEQAQQAPWQPDSVREASPQTRTDAGSNTATLISRASMLGEHQDAGDTAALMSASGDQPSMVSQSPARGPDAAGVALMAEEEGISVTAPTPTAHALGTLSATPSGTDTSRLGSTLDGDTRDLMHESCTPGNSPQKYVPLAASSVTTGLPRRASESVNLSKLPQVPPQGVDVHGHERECVPNVSSARALDESAAGTAAVAVRASEEEAAVSAEPHQDVRKLSAGSSGSALRQTESALQSREDSQARQAGLGDRCDDPAGPSEALAMLPATPKSASPPSVDGRVSIVVTSRPSSTEPELQLQALQGDKEAASPSPGVAGSGRGTPSGTPDRQGAPLSIEREDLDAKQCSPLVQSEPAAVQAHDAAHAAKTAQAKAREAREARDALRAAERRSSSRMAWLPGFQRSGSRQASGSVVPAASEPQQQAASSSNRHASPSLDVADAARTASDEQAGGTTADAHAATPYVAVAPARDQRDGGGAGSADRMDADATLGEPVESQASPASSPVLDQSKEPSPAPVLTQFTVARGPSGAGSGTGTAQQQSPPARRSWLCCFSQ